MLKRPTRVAKPSLKTTAAMEICLGETPVQVGRLVYVKDGTREFSQFAYTQEWLEDPRAFNVSPELSLRSLEYQIRKAPTNLDSCFFFALADTEPDSWGRRIIARARAKDRYDNPALGPPSELDYLCAVDDHSRIGALRLRDATQRFVGSMEHGRRTTPALLDLARILHASHAFEKDDESATELRYLLGNGTSLGGMRPKSTVLDADGSLALGKFPSVGDERNVTRAEVLTLKLAMAAGIDAAQARIEMVDGAPVAIIRRFDRSIAGARIPYISAATLLQAERGDSLTYTDLVDAMRSASADFGVDAMALWRRLLFNLLVTNVDDHLHNTGFLYVGQGQWRLSPAFDLNPFPDKARESKTMLSEDTGPITSVKMLLAAAPRFELQPAQAALALADVVRAVDRWKEVALSPEVGLTKKELADFANAFEHEQILAARTALK